MYAKYSIYDQLYMYDDRVHLENISRMSLREFLVSVAFKINVRITLKMLHTPIRNDVNLHQSSDFGEISLDNANDTPYKRHEWE